MIFTVYIYIKGIKTMACIDYVCNNRQNWRGGRFFYEIVHQISPFYQTVGKCRIQRFLYSSMGKYIIVTKLILCSGFFFTPLAASFLLIIAHNCKVTRECRQHALFLAILTTS